MLGVTDLHKSIAFYRDRLGLELTSQSEEFAFFNAGGVTLALTTELPQKGKDPGGVEVVFSVEHVRAAHQELRKQGIEFQAEPHVVTGSMWAANFSDPDRHALSVFGPE